MQSLWSDRSAPGRRSVRRAGIRVPDGPLLRSMAVGRARVVVGAGRAAAWVAVRLCHGGSRAAAWCPGRRVGPAASGAAAVSTLGPPHRGSETRSSRWASSDDEFPRRGPLLRPVRPDGATRARRCRSPSSRSWRPSARSSPAPRGCRPTSSWPARRRSPTRSASTSWPTTRRSSCPTPRRARCSRPTRPSGTWRSGPTPAGRSPTTGAGPSAASAPWTTSRTSGPRPSWTASRTWPPRARPRSRSAGCARRRRPNQSAAELLTSRSQALLALSVGLANASSLPEVASAIERVALQELGCLRAGVWVDAALVGPSPAPREPRGPRTTCPSRSCSCRTTTGPGRPPRPTPRCRSVATTRSRTAPSRGRRCSSARWPSRTRATRPCRATPTPAQARAFLPLWVGGQVLGCLVLTWDEARTFSRADRVTVRALAAYSAQAVSRAVLVEERLQASRILQNAMLTHLPQPDDLELAARYHPASTLEAIGGDWYDAVLLPSGCTAIAVGDVVGHDIIAAADMSQLRSVLRGLAWATDDSPARTVARLDRALPGLGIKALASLVFARVEQTEAQRALGVRTLRWTNAGHPPPLLVGADGTGDLAHRRAVRAPPRGQPAALPARPLGHHLARLDAAALHRRPRRTTRRAPRHRSRPAPRRRRAAPRRVAGRAPRHDPRGPPRRAPQRRRRRPRHPLPPPGRDERAGPDRWNRTRRARRPTGPDRVVGTGGHGGGGRRER